MRIGFGWDLHRLVPGRPLVLGGINVPSDSGEDAHSDGDVLIHALIDALLGALALGDIGSHFPPSDPRWKDAKSTILLEKVVEMLHKNEYRAVNIDTTVVLQSPKLGPHIEEIRSSLAQLLYIDIQNVSVKAKTHEKVGPIGEGKAVEAYASVLIEEADPSVWV
ncbi:MAG: 2-C-methyl-D-erythritol 2,4-cyclodiphosphate synthase [Spirochaetaceae bacterium]